MVATAQGEFPYDYVLIACGSETNFYANTIIREFAYTLDTVHDAEMLRASVAKDESTPMSLLAVAIPV